MYAWVPGDLKVCMNVWPFCNAGEVKPPAPPKWTVCISVSSCVHVTVLPASTVTAAGWKA